MMLAGRLQDVCTPNWWSVPCRATVPVQALVSFRADVGKKTRNGYNAMHFASTGKHMRTQQVLLEAGIQQNAPNFFRERTLT